MPTQYLGSTSGTQDGVSARSDVGCSMIGHFIHMQHLLECCARAPISGLVAIVMVSSAAVTEKSLSSATPPFSSPSPGESELQSISVVTERCGKTGTFLPFSRPNDASEIHNEALSTLWLSESALPRSPDSMFCPHNMDCKPRSEIYLVGPLAPMFSERIQVLPADRPTPHMTTVAENAVRIR
jgi:hypothetical protein